MTVYTPESHIRSLMADLPVKSGVASKPSENVTIHNTSLHERPILSLLLSYMQQINIFHPKLTTTSGTKDSIPCHLHLVGVFDLWSDSAELFVGCVTADI
jgi:hypothetical protein